ncbi:hypothetical protein IFR05_010734 [Cadophora sp. M221]|nr:hypothetical protein IFR05_010734 [Cadophora sp. M221]
MVPSMLIALGAAATIFALPVPMSDTSSRIRRLDLEGGTTVTYDPVTGDRRSLQRRTAESSGVIFSNGKIIAAKESMPDSLDASNLVKNGFGRGTYGIDTAHLIEGSGQS